MPFTLFSYEICILNFYKGAKSKKLPESIHCTVFNARTYQSPKNMLLSAAVKIICFDMVLGAQHHYRYYINFTLFDKTNNLVLFSNANLCQNFMFFTFFLKLTKMDLETLLH